MSMSGATRLAVGVPLSATVPLTCHLRDQGSMALPDPTCTPGALNPAVGQDTIASTICVPGYSSSVRPPQSFTYNLKVRQMRAWGITGPTSTIEEDHLVPLSLGGAPSDARNLWPEPGGIPNVKDALEARLFSLVCRGAVTLHEAQIQIATDWRSAYQRFVGPLPNQPASG